MIPLSLQSKLWGGGGCQRLFIEKSSLISSVHSMGGKLSLGSYNVYID